MLFVREETEKVKCNHRATAVENVVQHVLPGACALRRRFKVVVPESIQKLFEICDSNVSRAVTLSLFIIWRLP